MIDTDEPATRNAEFADGGSFADLKLMPGGNLTVIGCVAPRADPSDVLRLKLGEASVIRNVGGRVTPAALRTLGMLSKVVQARTGGPGPAANHCRRPALASGRMTPRGGCGRRDHRGLLLVPGSTGRIDGEALAGMCDAHGRSTAEAAWSAPRVARLRRSGPGTARAASAVREP
ncbi:hypothetical protein LVX13_26060, partial [Streptomyces albulus]|nr:hypothetical protein [Streptomyces noursei]